MLKCFSESYILKNKHMIGSIFRKYTKMQQKKKLIATIIENLSMNEIQKSLYLESLDILDEVGLEKLYQSLTKYMEEVERKKLEDITKENFIKIAGMRKKEVKEKQKDLNSF